MMVDVPAEVVVLGGGPKHVRDIEFVRERSDAFRNLKTLMSIKYFGTRVVLGSRFGGKCPCEAVTQ
jgi:hypothetical protein